MLRDQLIFNHEWIVEDVLTARTELNARQMRNTARGLGREGIHFKRVSTSGEKTQRGIIWYNYPDINRLIRDV